MKRKAVLLLFVSIILFFFSATLPADVVELKTGEIVEGEITEETEQFIAIERDSKTVFLKMEEVKSVTKSPLEAAAGKVVEATGTVEVLPKGQKQWAPAQEGTVLSEGDSVRTGPDSKAVAVLADQVIVGIEPKSSLGLEKLQQSPKKVTSTKVNLDGGQLWIDAGKLKTRNSRFHVATPAAVTGVRGTAFTVQAASDAKTTVAVVDGGVDVRTREMMEPPVHVKKNYMTEVSPNERPTKPVAISAAFLAQWAVWAAKFGLLKGGMGASAISPGQAAAGGAAAAAAGIAAVATNGSGGGSSPPPATITASESGSYSPTPIDTIIDGRSVTGNHTVTKVDVSVLCDPHTVADQFQIIYQGNVIADTGMVGQDLGDPGEDIPLNGSASGSSPFVTIRVVSGPLGTDWHWDATVTYHLK